MTHVQKNKERIPRFVLDSVVSIDRIFQEFDSRLRVLFLTTPDDENLTDWSVALLFFSNYSL